MLQTAKLTAFLATAKPEAAKAFYGTMLGLRLLSDDQFALAFDSGGIALRVQKVEKLQPQSHTALGWQVSNIRAAVKELSQRGVSFERYSFLEQDDLGIWQAPSGTKVVWFKDPDGNILSLSESPNS
jgi:catechol 2,3-dioxygenase-like lactoylglutathione lyase family enzyme